MQKFIIEEIGYGHGGNTDVFKRDDNTGFYISVSNNALRKGLNDFLFKPGYYIKSVTRKVGGLNPSVTRFSIGDSVSNESIVNTGNSIINSIEIELNDCILKFGNGVNQRIRLASATKFVAPTTTAKKTNTGENSVFESIAKKIEQAIRPVRLEKTLRKRKETIEEFLIKFFNEWNSEKETIYVEDGTTQTDTGRRRSLGDIYMILKYYYPTVTLNEVIKLLYVTLQPKMTPGFRTSYCTTIKKRVWYYAPEQSAGVFDKNTKDEYGNTYAFYIDNLIK